MDKDIGYYIFHNCKQKDCIFFPAYNKYIGRYDDCKLCEGCKTFEKALVSLGSTDD